MSRAFDLGNKIRRQKNGIATPPNEMTRVTPPEWKNYKLITATTSTQVVPQNVYQMLVMVWGAGASGGSAAGGGGGFAMGIVDVVPGQLLPTITVGTTAGATSSFGTLLSATGGTGAGGTGTANAALRGAFTASGGSGNTGNSFAGGAASGSPLGVGGSQGAANSTGGAAWGGVTATSTVGASTRISGNTTQDGFLALANNHGLSNRGAISATETPGMGCGQFSQADCSTVPVSPFGGGGAGGTTNGGRGGLGGGGGGGGAGGLFGAGAVILYWTEGY